MSKKTDQYADEQHHQCGLATDLGCALFFIVWAVVGWISVLTNPASLADEGFGLDPGPALMPILVLSVITLGGLVQAVRPVIAITKGTLRIAAPLLLDWRPLGVLISSAILPAAMQAVGYQAATFIFVLGWTYIFGRSRGKCLRRASITAVSTAVIVTLIVAIGFDHIIGARLP